MAYEIPYNTVKLYTTNKKVNSGNARSLAALEGDEYTLPSQDYFSGNKAAARNTLRETRLLHTLVVKIGVPLMLIHNVDAENGWTKGVICRLIAGLVVKYSVTNVTKLLKRVSRTVLGTGYSRYQYPVTVAFALHNSQGMYKA